MGARASGVVESGLSVKITGNVDGLWVVDVGVDVPADTSRANKVFDNLKEYAAAAKSCRKAHERIFLSRNPYSQGDPRARIADHLKLLTTKTVARL